MSDIPDRKFIDSKDLRPIQSGIGSLVESKDLLAPKDLPDQKYAVGIAAARSFAPSTVGWLGSRVGAVGGTALGGLTGNPVVAGAGGFAGSTFLGGASSSLTQWAQSKVWPVGAKEKFAAGKYPTLTQGGGYLAGTPFLRGAKFDEWSSNPLKTAQNAAGEFAGEGFGSLAWHLASGQPISTFDIKQEGIGALVEALIQNEETKLGRTITSGLGLGGNSIPRTRTPGVAPVSQRDLVAEATAGAPVAPPIAAPIATPGVTVPPVAGATGTTTPVITPGVATPAPVATVPPATATVPPVTNTVPPVAQGQAAPVVATEATQQPVQPQVAEEDFQPVQPRPESANMAEVWDQMYGETHRPDGRPLSFAEKRPSWTDDARKDPEWKPEFDQPDRGTGNLKVARRPLIIPQTVARHTTPDVRENQSVEEAMKAIEEASAKDPKVADYVKNNKAAVDQAVQAHLEWNKKYSKTHYSVGDPMPTEAERAVLARYNPSLNQDYGAQLAERQKKWDADHGDTGALPAWGHTGEPKNNKLASRKLREGIEFRKAGFGRTMLGDAGKRTAAWTNEQGDVIQPITEADGKRVYHVKVSKTGNRFKTDSWAEAVDLVKQGNAPKAPIAKPEPTAAPAPVAQTESKDTTETKDEPEAKDAKDEPQAQPVDTTGEIDGAAIAALFEKVPEYKWASPTGDAYTKFRMEVMKALGAEGVTKANSGVNNYRNLLINKLGINPKQTIAAIDKDIVKFLKQLFKGSSGSLDNDDSAQGAAPTTTTTKDKKPAGAKPAGPTTITKPITDEEKSKLKDLNFDEIRQENEDNEDDDADVNDPFHAIFTDIAERNGYMNKAEMRAHLEGVFGAKEFAGMDAHKALAQWTSTPKPVKWDGKKTQIAGTSHSISVVPNSKPKEKGSAYGGRNRSSVVIFDKDGKVVLFSGINEWRGKYSGASEIGPDVFSSSSMNGVNGMEPKYKSFEEMVKDIGKDEALKIYDELIKAQIAEMRKAVKGITFNAKNDMATIHLNIERYNKSSLSLGDFMDPVNELLGMTGEETDSEFAAAFEKRYGVTFTDAERGYVSGYDQDEKFRRHFEFTFNINAPGTKKEERGKHWMYELDNHDWVQAIKYQALFDRIKDPSNEAQELAKKIPNLAYEGSARKKAEAKLEALNEAYAKKVLDGMKVYSPQDSRYVKGSVTPDYYPGQTKFDYNEGEIESRAPMYDGDVSESLPDTAGLKSGTKRDDVRNKNLEFIKKNNPNLYAILEAHSSIAKEITALSEALQKGQSDDIDADINKHAELTKKLFKAKLDAIIEIRKTETRFEGEIKRAYDEYAKANSMYSAGPRLQISFDVAATKEAKNIEINEDSENEIKAIEQELYVLRSKKGKIEENIENNWDGETKKEPSKEKIQELKATIKELESQIKEAKDRIDSTSAVKKKTVNATLKNKNGESAGSAKINIGESVPSYFREGEDIEDGESATRVSLNVDWKSVNQEDLNGIIESILVRINAMRSHNETRQQDNLSQIVLFSTEGLDDGSIKMLQKATDRHQSKDRTFEKSTYSLALKNGKEIVFNFNDASTGNMPSDAAMSDEAHAYTGLDKEEGSWTRQAVRALVVESNDVIQGALGRSVVQTVDDLTDMDDEELDFEKLKIRQAVDKLISKIGPEMYGDLKKMVQDMKDFKSGKMFGDKGVQQEAKPTAATKPTKPTKPVATEAKPATPATDSVTAMAQEKPNDSASLKTARTKLRAVIEKLGADSQQAVAMSKNIARAEDKQASFNKSAEGITKPYGNTPEPDSVTKARAQMAVGLKKGQVRGVAYKKAEEIVNQYESEHDLYTGTVTEDGIRRVSNKVLEDFLQRAQDAINAAGGIKKAGDVLKGELGLMFNMAQDEFQRRMKESERKDEYGDLLADIAGVIKTSNGSIAVPTLPKALKSSYSEMSEMFDSKFTTGKNSILRQPMHGIDVQRYLTDKEYKKQVNNTAEAMLESLAERLDELGWAQFNPRNFSSNELMDALYEAGMGRPLVPKSGVMGASWKGDVGNVANVANTDTATMPQDLFQASEKPKQLGAKKSNDLIDEADTFSLSGETAATAPTQTVTDDKTQDLAPDTQEPAYIAQARTQLSKLEKAGASPAQQRTLRDTIEQYEATLKQAQPKPEATQQADKAFSQELKDQFDDLVTEAESTMNDLESTAGGTAASDKEVNGKKGIIAMAREAIQRADPRGREAINKAGYSGPVSHQEASDMLRAASTKAVDLLESHQEKASNIEDMGREDPFAEREDMIDQLQDLANQLDILADIIDEGAGAQAEGGEPAVKMTRKDIDREIQRLRDEQKKEMDAVLDSNMPYRETNDALTALSKKYEPQFKKLTAELKKLTKNDPGAMSVEGAIGRDGEFARFVTGLKKKLDAGTITQAEYDEAYARVQKAGRVERSTDDADSAKNEEVPKEGGKTTIKGQNIAMPLPDSITNQDKKDAIVVLLMTEIRNQVRNSQNGIGTRIDLGDMRKIKGAEAFVFEKIKAFLDKNPSASYLQVVANLYQASLPNSTKSLKGKLADAQALHAILMDAYRTAVANLRLSQIANGVPESEVVSDDILGHRNKDLSGWNVMTQIGLTDDIVRYLNTEDAPYDTRQKDGKKGKPKDDAQYLRGNTAYNIEKTFDEIVDKLIKTGKHTTTTSLLDAVVAELETQVKQLDTDIQNEILTKIKAFVNSRKGDQPFSRFDRQADDNDKARELDTRVARNSKNRQGDPDARKGFTGMISRALDELRLRGEITAKEAEGLTRIMNYIGSQFFSGEKMSIKNDSERGYYGMYSFGDKVLTIFRDAMRDGRFEYTAAHEIAHLLTKYLPDKDRKDLINEWRTARMKFLKDNPGIAAILKDPYADFNSIHFSSLEIQKAESIQPGVTKAFVKKELQVGLRGKTKTVYVVAAHEGVYQVFNADEYFAENFVRVVMKRLNSDPAYTGNPKTWREKLASLWDMIKTGFRQMFGKDVTARILADFAKGRISPDMKGNYGLTDLHNAMPSKGDRKVGIDAMARDQRMGDDALVVTEKSERELKENLIKSADKSMTIKDAVHMVLRGVTGPKADLIRLLTSKIDKDYRVQFSSKKYSQLYSSTTKTSEGRDINADKVIGVHVEKGGYIRVFLPAIETKSSRLNASLADVVSYVLTHEVIHSYTTSVIDKNSKLRAQAQALVDEIKNELGLTMGEMHIEEKFYGLTSPGELMTECLIDPELRKIANSIQSKTKRLSEIEGNTLLDKIISVFQSALESVGIKVNKDSVLDRMSEIIAVEREKADAVAPRSKGQIFYMASQMNQKAGNYTETEDYSYSPDSPTADQMRLDASRRTKREQIAIKNEMERAKRYRDQGMEDVADDVERGAAEMQSQLESYLEEQDKRIQGVMPMLEQAIPDLRKIDGNDTPSARETLLGIRDDVMPSIGPANRPPTRKNEEKNIAQIAWDVVSGRYFSGLSAKAHQNAERHDYSEAVKQVANMIHSRPGVNSSTSERDIPTAMMTSRIRFQNKFNTIVDPLKGMLSGFKDSNAGTAKEQREVVYRALHDMIRGEKPITKGKLGEVATNLKKLFEELREYRVGAGEQLGDVKDYFPAVYDSPRIAQERDAFTRDASEAYKITIQDLANSDIYLKKMSKMDSKYLAKMLGVTQDEVEAGVTEKGASIADLMQQKAVDQANAALAKELGISKEEVEDGASKAGVSIDQLILERSAARANELFQTHLRGMGSSEFDSIFGGQTGSEQENSNLKRVFAAEAQKVMSKWQVADPFRVVTSYITSSVKKAEVVRKFGAEGEIWKQYSEQMEADGVPYETIAEMRELVRVASGYGIPPKGKAAQTYVDSITMMTAASAMGRGFLNNLVEPVTMGIRAGNPLMAARGLIETWTRFVREIASLSPALKAKFGETFWSEYGKEIGTIHSSIEDAWMATHSMDLDADRADPRFRWITNRIYQANLMDASETAKQQASHAIGYSYILGLAKLKKGKSWMNNLGMDPAQSTTDQLNELGIPEEDHGRFADYVMGLEKKNDIDKMKAMTDRSEDNDLAKMHQEAMVRFSYQSSVRSNRAHKPIFQDDLFGKTVLQLMNFSYSFAAEVNTRIFSMTKQAFMPSPDGKNYNLADRARMAAPLLSGFMAIVAYKMLFSMKDELYPTEGTEKRKKDPEFLKWVNATSYAGFLGPKVEQLIKIIKRDQAPGGPVGQSLVNVARAATTAAESLAQGKDMTAARRQASKAAIPIIKGSLNAGASAINPILGAVTTQATNTTGWANEFTKDETKANKGIGDALFAKPIKNKPIEK